MKRTTSETTMKRSTSGGIAAAFAKAPPARPKKQKEEEKETPPTSKPASPEPVPRISAKRQKELDEINKMMEDDEEPQRTIPPGISKQKLMIELEDFPPDAPVEGGEEKVETPAESGAETPTEDIPKRKRGKRKVLKKTTKRDEKGYLVTKNEYVYESFSEEEESDTAPKKKLERTESVASTGAGGGKKKAGGKGGVPQKSLMSFFGKK